MTILAKLFVASFLIFASKSHAALSPTDRAENPTVSNMLAERNPGFESGRQFWTASGGTVATVTSGANLLNGKVSLTWDSNATGQTLRSALVPIPENLKGNTIQASCAVKVPSGTSSTKMQVWDGTNVLAELTLPTLSKATESTLHLIAPNSGSLAIRFISEASNEPLLAIDDCFLGKTPVLSIPKGASYVGSFTYTGDPNCRWQVTSATFTNFPADSDCVTTVADGSVLAPLTAIPGFRLQNPKAGRYVVRALGHFRKTNTNAGNWDIFRLSDGTLNGSGQGLGADNLDTTVGFLTGTFTYTGTEGTRTIQIQAGTTAVSVAHEIYAEGNGQLRFEVFFYPDEASQKVVNIDTSGWFAEANIFSSGTNAEMGTSNLSTYSEILHSGLTLDLKTNSQPLQITCDNAVSTGSTCAGTATLGVTANLPYAGKYEACFDFSHYKHQNGNGNIFVTFQVVSTDDGVDATFVEGNSKLQSESGSTTNLVVSPPSKVCGVFDVSQAGRKSFKLYRVQSFSVPAVVVGNSILTDRDSSNGSRDVYVSIRPLSQVFPVPVFPEIQNVLKTGDKGFHQQSARIVNNGSTCVADRTTGTWVSPTRTGVGSCELTISGFTTAPVCKMTPSSGTAPNMILVGDPTSSLVTTQCYNTTSAGNQDCNFHISCVGQQ